MNSSLPMTAALAAARPPWYVRAARSLSDRAESLAVSDYGIQRGDWVVSPGWPRPVRVVDVNWALLAAAVRLYGADMVPGAVVVWPVHRMRRVGG